MMRELIIAGIAIVQTGLCCLTGYAQNVNDADKPPFQVTVTFREAQATTIVLDEPIVLRYRIKNISSHSVTMDLNLFERSWYALAFHSGNGTSVDNIVLPPKPVEGFTGIKATLLMPGQQCEGFIVAGRWSSDLRPGKGAVYLSVALRYELVSSNDEFPEKFSLLSQPGPTWKKSFNVSLEILPTDTLTLRREARKLAQASFKQEGNERKPTLKSLFLFPEEAALSSWTLLAATPTVGYEIIPFLADLSFRRVADLLESIGWPPNDREIIAAQSVLRRMHYETKDDDLKIYLSKILARHNVKTAE